MKILLLAGHTKGLITFRGEFMRELVFLGHTVAATAPEPDTDNVVEALGGRFIQLAFSRSGMNPLAQFSQINAYRKLIRRENPDRVIAYGIKSIVYGLPVARREGVKHVYGMVAGLGNAFIPNNSIKHKLVLFIAKLLYKHAARKADKLIFLNPDDKRDFINMRILDESRAAMIRGEGVLLEGFTYTPLPENPCFIFLGRLLREKGVVEYLEACKVLKRKHPEFHGFLLGAFESHGLSEPEVQSLLQSSGVEYLGEVEDVRPYLARSSVLVLPSYREGTPVCVMEAMATGRAVIVADTPGCRETVIHGKTGLLVPPRDAKALADAMEELYVNPDKALAMGQAGRAFCEENFDVRKINKELLMILGV